MQQLSRSCTSSPMAQCIKNASTASASVLSPPAAAAAITSSHGHHARRFSFTSLSSSPAAQAAITPRAFHTASSMALAVPSFNNAPVLGVVAGSRPRSSSDGGCFLVPIGSAPFSSSALLMCAAASASSPHAGPFASAGALSPGGAAAGGPGPILRASTRSRFHSLASLHNDEEDELSGSGGMGSHWRACVLDAEVDGGGGGQGGGGGGSYGDISLDSIENETANTAPVRFAIEWRGDTQATGAVVASSSSAFSSSAASSTFSSSASPSSSSSSGVAATLVSAHRWIESDVSKLSVARGAVWQKDDENDESDRPVPLAL